MEETKQPEEMQEPIPEEQPKEPKQKKESKKEKEWKKQLEQLQKEKDDYFNALLRERADFENYKKRNVASISKAYADGAGDAVQALLPAMDNLDRAIAAAEDGPLKTGVEMVLRQMLDALQKLGVTEIEAQGKPFDPNLHNAIMQVEKEEGEEGNMVKEVLQKGYQMKERILRHSMVKVTQ